MNNFNFGGRSRGGRDSFKRDYGDSGRPSMHDAVCDECGRNCQVPFRPTGDKPIYCSECFEKRGGGSDKNRPDSRSPFRQGSRDRTSSRSQDNTGERAIQDLAGKINVLNNKLDKIISLLSEAEQKKSALAEKTPKKKNKSKPKKNRAKKPLNN